MLDQPAPRQPPGLADRFGHAALLTWRRLIHRQPQPRVHEVRPAVVEALTAHGSLSSVELALRSCRYFEAEAEAAVIGLIAEGRVVVAYEDMRPGGSLPPRHDCPVRLKTLFDPAT